MDHKYNVNHNTLPNTTLIVFYIGSNSAKNIAHITATYKIIEQ